MDDWVTIKNIKKRNPKLGTRQITSLLGISRNTVKKALNDEQPPEYKREVEINPKIAPYTEYIFERLIAKRMEGSLVFEEIQSKSYKGSMSAYYRYISRLNKPVDKTCNMNSGCR